MKKGQIIAVAIAAAVAVVILNFLPFGFGSANQEKSISENFTSLAAEAENAKIEILPAGGDTASVELTGNKNGKYKLRTDVDGGTLHVELKKKWFQFFSFDLFNLFNRSAPALKVFLPEKAYESIEAETENGKITSSELEADHVNMEADNGIISLEKIKSTSIHVEVDNGDVSLNDVEGEISGTSDNGRITLITESLDRPINLETDNGIISIQTEEKPANATFDIQVDNGLVRVFGESTYDTVVGDGDNVIKLTADNGKITIR